MSLYLFDPLLLYLIVFFFNDTATTEIYTLSLHDALPISNSCPQQVPGLDDLHRDQPLLSRDRKSTRLNSSHQKISYAGFCLKKKKLTSLGRHTHTHKKVACFGEQRSLCY